MTGVQTCALPIYSRTNRIAWQKRTPYSIGQGSGALVTASDLLFHGEPDGRFQAYDARNGELLWHWQAGAGADAPAITYEIDGVQFLVAADKAANLKGERPLPSIARFRTASISDAREGNKPRCARTEMPWPP